MLRLPVRSRRWNRVLAIVGAVYAVSAIVLLAWFIIDVWKAASIADRLLQLALLMSALCGAWMYANARANLGAAGAWRAQRMTRSTAQ